MNSNMNSNNSNMNSSTYYVVDGLYKSDDFASYDQALADATQCVADEGFSGKGGIFFRLPDGHPVQVAWYMERENGWVIKN